MKKGGIFQGSSLGQLSGGDIDCTGTSLFNAVKAALIAKGYTGLALKTSWDGCFASAIVKELGHPMLTVGDVRQLTGGGCTTGYVDTPFLGGDLNPLMPGAGPVDAPSCGDGSDGKGSLPGPGTVDPKGPLSNDCITNCGKQGMLTPAWTSCMAGCGGSILTPTTPTQPPSGQSCLPGMYYDTNAKSCVLVYDPTGCGSKCTSLTPFTPEWLQCMVNCGAKAIGPGGTPIVVPGTNPPVPAPSSNPLASIFGDNWLLITAALAIGVGAVVYFGKKKTPVAATPNRKRRHRRSRRNCR